MLKKPRHLQKGDQVGIVAPSAIFDRAKFKLGVDYLKSIGLKPVLARDIFKKDFIFSGSTQTRVESFYDMAMHPELKAIWCVRGGYGAYDVAQELGRFAPPPVPKVVIGMSDITALHLLMIQKWKWPGLHAPLVDRIGQEKAPLEERKNFERTLLDPDFRLKINKGLKSIAKKGVARAPVVGGNLALLVASFKTAWEVNTDGKILFIEDIGERAYRLDRMFFQLRVAGKFDRVKAVVLGDFTECREPDGRELWREVVKRHLGNAKFPVVSGFPSGHGDLRLSIPFGVEAEVSTRGAKPHFEILGSYAR